MAVLYVDDGGNDSDGSSWANAFQSIEHANIVGAAPGSTIYIGSDHQESTAGPVVIDFAAGTVASPVVIISADITSGEPPATYESMEDEGSGKIEVTGDSNDMTFSGNVIAYGLRLIVSDVTTLGASGEITRFVDCYFDSTDALQLNAGNEGHAIAVGCTFDTPNDMIALVANNGRISLRSCAVTGGVGDILFDDPDDSTAFLLEDCDLSAQKYIVADLAQENAQVTVRRCKLHADTLADPTNGATIDHPDTWILIESSAPGDDTDPVMGLNYFGGMYGTITPDTSEYRTGGASDGTTPYSWLMTCNANTLPRHSALKTPPIVAWVTPTDTTLTIYVAHEAVGAGTAGDLLDTECWLEVSTPDDASPATAQGDYYSTVAGTDGVPNPLKAASDLTNEGSDEWQDTPATYQQITLTIDMEEEGPLIVRVCLATGGADAIWVDPKAHVS